MASIQHLRADGINSRMPWRRLTLLAVRPLSLAALLWVAASHAQVALGPDGTETGKIKVAPVVALQAEPFPLPNVRLLEGPFRHAMELDHAYLLSLDPDRLLHSFRLNAGLPSTVTPYGGWMTPGRVSCAEFVGHYLSACALMCASTGDERLKENASRVVSGLAVCQEKLGTRYLHTKPDNFTTRGEAPLGLWCQIHKLMAGLMEVYVNSLGETYPHWHFKPKFPTSIPIQLKHPGDRFPHGEKHRFFEHAGPALQAVIFHRRETLYAGHPLIRAGQPAHPRQWDLVISAANFRGQRHADTQRPVGVLIFARDHQERAKFPLHSQIHPINLTRLWLDHKNFPRLRRAIPTPRQAIQFWLGRLLWVRA